MLDKFEIADALREISLLLDLKRENPYKSRAYSIGASAVESISEDIGRVIDEGRLTNIRGIGDSLAHQIEDLYENGTSPLLQRLRTEMPPGVIELSQVPGLSVKKIQMLHDELGISSLEQLEDACRRGKVSKIRGFGKKTEANILEGIQQYRQREQQELLLHALDLTRTMVRYLQGARCIQQVEPAGSVRRWKDVVHNINLAAATESVKEALNIMQRLPMSSRTESVGTHDCTVRLGSGMKVHLLCASKQNFPVAWLIETGSPAHVEHLQRLAKSKGYTLDPSGLKRNGQLIEVSGEADIYHHLGLPYLPPEIREDAGEIEEALSGRTFDDLVRIEDIQGMTHCHTVYSDGKNTVEEMALAAQAMGMQYITITDHSPNAHYAGGLDVDRLRRQWEEIEQAQEKVKIKILRGTESDILQDGRLDYPEEILDQFDVIIASIHSRLKMDEAEMTGRLLRCMSQKQFKVWGHPLGRLVLRRQPLQARLEEVFDLIAESRAAIEVNGDPYRLDLPPELIRQARKRGIPFIISVDAHSTGALNYLRYGVHTARRGWLRKREVLNTLPVDQFRAAVRPS